MPNPSDSHSPPSGRRVEILAAFWGFAEATLFFIIPDVLISFVALRGLRRALFISLLAALGAVAGGGLMYAWGSQDREAALAAIDRLPAISAEMIEEVGQQNLRHGLLAPFLGPTQGKPYKIYAAQAPATGLPLIPFLLITVPVRMVRFILLSLVFSALSRYPLGRWPMPYRMAILAGCWLLIYVAFFIWMQS